MDPVTMGLVGGASLANLGGAIIGGNAMKSAAQQQAEAAQQASALQHQQFLTMLEMNAPYTAAGGAGVTELAHRLGIGGTGYNTILEGLRSDNPLMHGRPIAYGVYQYEDGTTGQSKTKRKFSEGQLQAMAQEQFRQTDQSGNFGSLLKNFTAEDLQADPVYQSGLEFGLNEGRDAINARAALTGGYDSGATLKALTRYGNDYGSTKANESYNRYRANQGDIYNRLAGISGVGQTATNQVGAAGMNMANQIGQNMMGAANARGAASIGQAGLWSQGIGNTLNFAQNQQYLNRLGGGTTAPGSFGNAWFNGFDE